MANRTVRAATDATPPRSTWTLLEMHGALSERVEQLEQLHSSLAAPLERIDRMLEGIDQMREELHAHLKATRATEPAEAS